MQGKAGSIVHPSRSSYLTGCRCAPCTRANADYQEQRRQRIAAGHVPDVHVDARPARMHLLDLQRLGVGIDSIASAADVHQTAVMAVRSGRRRRIRQSTLRKLLAVDVGCRLDGVRISSRRTLQLIEEMARKGFTKLAISKLIHEMGGTERAHYGRSVTVRTQGIVERIHRKVLSGEVKPPLPHVPGARPDELAELRARGVEAARSKRELLLELQELRRMRRAS